MKINKCQYSFLTWFFDWLFWFGWKDNLYADKVSDLLWVGDVEGLTQNDFFMVSKTPDNGLLFSDRWIFKSHIMK